MSGDRSSFPVLESILEVWDWDFSDRASEPEDIKRIVDKLEELAKKSFHDEPLNHFCQRMN